jgi:hypothetical protein
VTDSKTYSSGVEWSGVEWRERERYISLQIITWDMHNNRL